MIIGIDARTLMDYNYSGVSGYTLNIINALLEVDTKNQYKLYYNSFRDINSRLPKFNAPNLEIVHTKYPNKLLNYGLFNALDWPKIDKTLRCDVFFMPHINFISLMGTARSVLTIHDLSFIKYPEFFSVRKNIWHKFINAKQLVKKFDKIVAISENTKKDIIELLDVDASRISVIHSGLHRPNLMPRVKVEMIKKKLDLPDKYLLCLGNVEPRKNIEGVILAYNELRKKNTEFRNFKLVVVGALGWKCEDFFKAIHNSPYRQDIVRFGYVSKEFKQVIYEKASILLFPSFYEGFGFPPLEAMSYGTPVIVSNVSCLPEIVNNTAIMINPLNVTEIILAVESILNNEPLKNRLTKVGLNNSSNFNWITTAKKYLSIFNHS